MKNGIPNQKYRAKRMIDSMVRDFSGSDPKAILVVTYLLDKDVTFKRIRQVLEDADIDYGYTGDYNLNSDNDMLSSWITLVSVDDSMEYGGPFTDAYIFCEKEHLGKEVENRVNYCTDTQCIFDREVT
jgi:hypothetical protein